MLSKEEGKEKSEGNKNEELRSYAICLFGEEIFEKLVQWYRDIIGCGADYIVFIVRRCYVLFLIMEDITGIRLEKADRSNFLTDSSVLLHTKEMVHYYDLYGRFPSIVFVDDIFVHGRNVNNLLHTLERNLVDIIINNGYLNEKIDQTEIELSLARATIIKVFVSYQRNRLLDYRYRDKLEAFIPDVSQSYWREFSNNVSELIVNSDVLNASFIYSNIIEKPSQDILEDFVKTTYQGCDEYAMIESVNNQFSDGLKAYTTVRLVVNPQNGNIRLAPFVFLPTLSEDETDRLVRGIIEEFDDLLITDWISVLKDVKGRRAYNEAITMIISTMYLFQMKNKYGFIFDQDDKCKEIKKLARNYDMEHIMISHILEQIIKKSEAHCNSLQTILCNAIDDYKVQYNYFDDVFVNRLLLLWEESYNKNVFFKRERMINEVYFYKKGWEEERSAFNKKEDVFIYEKNAPRGEAVFKMLSSLSYIGAGKTLDNNYNIRYYISYILQMMDAGIVGIAMADLNSPNENRLYQYAKVGEQSQQLLPLKMCEYISFMNMVEERAESTHREIVDELSHYFDNAKCNLTDEAKYDIKNFLEILEDIGQKPKDWAGYLYRKFAISCHDDNNDEDAEKIKADFVSSDMKHKLNYLQNMF